MIREIKRALRDLANGNYHAKIDKKLVAYEDFEVIAESIDQLGDDLDRHRKSRREWLKNISHDLNTPLTSMNILLSGAEDGLFPLNSDLIKALKKEADILAGRIASVNYYSTLLSQRELNTVSADITEILASAIYGRSCCTLEKDDGIPPLDVDYDLVKRAFSEILDNSEEYGEKGGTTSIAVRMEKDGVAVYFTNRGHLPSPRPPFFEPWARGDASRHEGGSGLGLPIVHQIMELHHGSVEIDELDGFVEVRLFFPHGEKN